MNRRYNDDYAREPAREARERSGRDVGAGARDTREYADTRPRSDQRSAPDSMDTGDSRYVSRDQTARNPPYQRDDREEPGSNRQFIDLERRQREPAAKYNEYFLPGEDINREVIQNDICRYLGQDALVQQWRHNDGRQGYLIRAYRALTTNMITSLKEDSKKWEAEREKRVRHGYSSGTYDRSSTLDDRNQAGPQLPRENRYTGFQAGYMDVDDNDEDMRDPARGYSREQDARQAMPTSRHALPSVPQGAYQEPAYQYSAQQAPGYDYSNSAPRFQGNRTPPQPTLGRGTQPMYPAGYTVPTSAPLQGAAQTYVDPATGRTVIPRYPPGYQEPRAAPQGYSDPRGATRPHGGGR